MEQPLCYFNNNYFADGKPFICNMHKIPGLKDSIKVVIPRSRIAQKAHTIGRMIKIISIVFAGWIIYYAFKFNINLVTILLISSGILFLGGAFCQLFYRYLGIKSKFSSIKKHPEVISNYKKGYRTGLYPAMSIFPISILIRLLNLLF